MGRVRKPEPLWISLFRLVKKATAATTKPPLPAGAASAASTAPNLILKALRCGSLQTESLRYAADSFSHLLLPSPTPSTSAPRSRRRRRRALPSPAPRCFSRPQTDSFRVHHVVDQEALTQELDYYEDYNDASVSRSSSATTAATSSATCSATSTTTTTSTSNNESYSTAPSTFADRLSSISSCASSPGAGMLISSSDEDNDDDGDVGDRESCWSRCRVSDAECSGDVDRCNSDTVELLSDDVLADFTASVVEMVICSRYMQEEQLEALFYEYLRLNPAELHATIALAFVNAIEHLADAANFADWDVHAANGAEHDSTAGSCAGSAASAPPTHRALLY